MKTTSRSIVATLSYWSRGKRTKWTWGTRLRERLRGKVGGGTPKDQRECTAEIMLWYGNVTSSGERGRVWEWEGDGVGWTLRSRVACSHLPQAPGHVPSLAHRSSLPQASGHYLPVTHICRKVVNGSFLPTRGTEGNSMAVKCYITMGVCNTTCSSLPTTPFSYAAGLHPSVARSSVTMARKSSKFRSRDRDVVWPLGKIRFFAIDIFWSDPLLGLGNIT
jgi:hypothetical protein